MFKTKISRILSLLTAMVMVAGIAAACGEKKDVNAPAVEAPAVVETSQYNSKVPRDTFMVGTPAMNGDFISGFGNSSYDLYIKTLTGGYADTYYASSEGQLLINNTIVKKQDTKVDATGNKTYTFTLHEDLKWSDGSSITAKDYIGCILMYASPKWAEVGATSSLGEGLIGYNEYYDGDTEVFAGIKVLGEYEFSLTIDAEELPYFYETAWVAVGPICMASYFPGIEIVSDANGSSFDGDITADCQRISQTERFAPTVICGPYMFVNYDGSTVNLKKNPYFKGDWNGKKPSFEYIVQLQVPSETDTDMVLSGDIDFVGGTIEGAKINAAKASDNAVAYSYLRAGYGHLSMHCDWGPTKDPNVRWAIACIIDRNAVIDHVLDGYGGTVDAAFGMAQWTYAARKRQLDARLQPIAFNLAKANEFLDKSEWAFEADGKTAYDSSKANADGTYMRYNSSGEMLVINHLSASPVVGNVIESETIKNAPMVGMKYNVTHGEFDDLLTNYYYGFELGEDRFYNTFNLASNFSVIDDKYDGWHSDYFGTWVNANQLSDPEIDRLTLAMRRLDPSETEKFADLWVDFQVRWQELLPQVPLYSNEYFDIYNSVVKSVPTSPYANYCDVICDIEKY